MWLYEKTDFHNRMVTFKMAQRVVADVLDGTEAMTAGRKLTSNQADALRYVTNIEPGIQREMKQLLRGGRDNVEEINKTLSRYMVSKTQFHYNRAAMSEYGRSVGPLLSMFTKWPVAITSEIGSNYLRMGAGRATWESTYKFLGPLIFLGIIDKLALPDPAEDDRTRLLVGGGGLAGWTPIQAARGFVTGEFASPPLVDAAIEAVAVTAEADPRKFRAWLERSAKYWTPGMSALGLLFDDIPTLTEGKDPQYIDKWLTNILEEIE
jgi:hypothetical protein